MRRSSRLSHSLRVTTVVLATAALTACFGLPGQQDPTDPGGTSDPQPSDVPTTPSGDAAVEQFIVGANTTGGSTEGTVVDEQIAAGSGPTATTTDSATVVNGGSLQLDVASDSEFSTVLVGISPTTVGTGTPTPGVDQYEVELAEPTDSTSLVLTMSQSLPATEFTVVVAVVDESGEVGQLAATQIAVVEVGTGDVQVSVGWSDDSDVDLYVVDPNGDVIYYGATESSSGGELDLDSNPACSIDGVRNENITWPTGEAPSGTYEVRINLYADCDIEQTSWVVTVNVLGTVRTWEGILEAPGVGGSSEAGQVVTTFEVP